MTESILFGEKDIFSIELKDYNAKQHTGKIRLWLNGQQLGDLKTQDELYDAIKSFKFLITSKETLYDKAFDLMTNEQIFSHCLLLDKNFDSFTEDDYKLVNQMRETFSRWFGEQLDNVVHVILFKGEYFHFLYSYNDYASGKIEYLKNLRYSKVPSENVENVILSFLNAVR